MFAKYGFHFKSFRQNRWTQEFQTFSQYLQKKYFSLSTPSDMSEIIKKKKKPNQPRKTKQDWETCKQLK